MNDLIGTAALSLLIWISLANHSIFFCCKKKKNTKSNTTPRSKGNTKTPNAKGNVKGANKVVKMKTAMSAADCEVSEPDLISDQQLQEGELGSQMVEEKTCEGKTLQSREVVKSIVHDNKPNVNPNLKGARAKTVDTPTDLHSVVGTNGL